MNGKGSKRNNPIHNFATKSPHSLDEINDECWNWTGSLDKDGYGVFTLDGKKTPAHVAAYKLSLGEIKGGLYVLHKCHNSSCVNPLHLYLGNQKQNVKDQIDRGTFVYGSKNGKAKLKDEDVLYARSSGLSCRRLADYYQVSYYTMWDILNNRSWKHLLKT